MSYIIELANKCGRFDDCTMYEEALQLFAAEIRKEQAANISEVIAENLENCRLLGISAERELSLLAEIERLKRSVFISEAHEKAEQETTITLVKQGDE